MTKPTTKKTMFSKIETREDALEVIKDSSNGFFVVAAIQIAIGIFLMPSIILDGVVFAVLGLLLRQLHSRVVAVLLLMVSISSLVMTIMNKFDAETHGGSNIYLAGIMVYVSVRAIQATFKYQTLLKSEEDKEDILDSMEA